MDKKNATPEDYERHARFLDRLRPWVWLAACVLGAFLVWAIWFAFTQ
jgi:hypothetical protein